MVNTNVLKFPLDILCLLCRAYCPVIVFNHCFSLSCDRGVQRTVTNEIKIKVLTKNIMGAFVLFFLTSLVYI